MDSTNLLSTISILMLPVLSYPRFRLGQQRFQLQNAISLGVIK